MKELQQALDRICRPRREHGPQSGPGSAADRPVEGISSRDLQRMLDRARDLARNGARDQARELLSQLQNMLETCAWPGPIKCRNRIERGAADDARHARLMQRQQQLLDRSFRAQQQQGQQAQPGGWVSAGSSRGRPAGPQAQMGDAAGQQEGLRRTLGEMMRRLGDGSAIFPTRWVAPTGDARRHRGIAAAAPGEAIGPQTEALDQLQQAARDFAQQMQRVCKANGATRAMTRPAPPTDYRG